MTPTPKTPTASGISRLLAAAGFERSNHGDKGVMWNMHSTGYRAYSGTAADKRLPFVTVLHFDDFQHCCEDCYDRHKNVAAERLSQYAEVIDAAGFDADLKLEANPRLSVTAKPSSPLAAKTETGFGGWSLDRLTAQRDHLQSILLVSVGQSDRPQIREEYDAVCAEITKRSKEGDHR